MDIQETIRVKVLWRWDPKTVVQSPLGAQGFLKLSQFPIFNPIATNDTPVEIDTAKIKTLRYRTTFKNSSYVGNDITLSIVGEHVITIHY